MPTQDNRAEAEMQPRACVFANGREGLRMSLPVYGRADEHGDCEGKMNERHLDAKLRERVEKATVTFERSGARGVLIPNGMIVTAAHCIPFTSEGDLTLRSRVACEWFTTSTGARVCAELIAIEPLADVAVLGAPDADLPPRGARTKFDQFCEETEPVPVRLAVPELQSAFETRIFTHYGRWVDAKATVWSRNHASIWFETTERIDPGSSGSPVVDSGGCLVAVVSTAGESKPWDASGPFVGAALPTWIASELTGLRMVTDRKGAARWKRTA